MSVLLSAIVRALFCPLLGLAVSTAAQTQPDAQESDRGECRSLLPSETGPDAIARAWWERNHDAGCAI